ncbi:Hypothetical protein PHPALM_14042 [Phytophthora palmivora]|uniref:Uncharacterized protein n=1 Tax=Phytophthora palmivora TaxID=4796 RepID=A0A2P4XVR9_9STRA|nr:Hypothetical protein PHPALM_14042 [Phytophthora palmivora]
MALPHQNVTRRCSVYAMVARYVRIRDGGGAAFDLIPKTVIYRRFEALLVALSNFKSVTVKPEMEKLSLAEVLALFDSTVQHFYVDEDLLESISESFALTGF